MKGKRVLWLDEVGAIDRDLGNGQYIIRLDGFLDPIIAWYYELQCANCTMELQSGGACACSELAYWNEFDPEYTGVNYG